MIKDVDRSCDDKAANKNRTNFSNIFSRAGNPERLVDAEAKNKTGWEAGFILLGYGSNEYYWVG
jgi:hypothetical protein